MLGAASCHHRSFPCCGSMEGSGSHNVLNEDLIKDVLGGHAGHGSCKEFFGTKGNYEVFTIFAKTSEHLKAIDMSDLSAGKTEGCTLLYVAYTKESTRGQRNGCCKFTSGFDAADGSREHQDLLATSCCKWVLICNVSI